MLSLKPMLSKNISSLNVHSKPENPTRFWKKGWVFKGWSFPKGKKELTLTQFQILKCIFWLKTTNWFWLTCCQSRKHLPGHQAIQCLLLFLPQQNVWLWAGKVSERRPISFPPYPTPIFEQSTDRWDSKTFPAIPSRSLSHLDRGGISTGLVVL